jgi:hypothetical protein
MQENSGDERRVKVPKDAEESKEEQDLDEALYDTFPASDPVSVVQKGEPTAPARGEESDRKRKADEVKRK